jgi:hypothetical protein
MILRVVVIETQKSTEGGAIYNIICPDHFAFVRGMLMLGCAIILWMGERGEGAGGAGGR